jgi:hypothetical protein
MIKYQLSIILLKKKDYFLNRLRLVIFKFLIDNKVRKIYKILIYYKAKKETVRKVYNNFHLY